jgi:hypothetical protein
MNGRSSSSKVSERGRSVLILVLGAGVVSIKESSIEYPSKFKVQASPWAPQANSSFFCFVEIENSTDTFNDKWSFSQDKKSSFPRRLDKPHQPADASIIGKSSGMCNTYIFKHGCVVQARAAADCSQKIAKIHVAGRDGVVQPSYHKPPLQDRPAKAFYIPHKSNKDDGIKNGADPKSEISRQYRAQFGKTWLFPISPLPMRYHINTISVCANIFAINGDQKPFYCQKKILNSSLIHFWSPGKDLKMVCADKRSFIPNVLADWLEDGGVKVFPTRPPLLKRQFGDDLGFSYVEKLLQVNFRKQILLPSF